MRYFIVTLISICLLACSQQRSLDQETVKKEIDSILHIQDQAYHENSENAHQRMAATCVDSLVFIGGDDGGMVTSAQFYAHDLADGFIEWPHDRTYHFYQNAVITTAIYKSFKRFNRDTIYFNNRSTKVFVRRAGEWKMAYVSFAPMPLHYEPRVQVEPAKLAQLVGVYESATELPDTVKLIDGHLYLAPSSELVPINDSTFFGEGFSGQTVFHRTPAGKVTYSYFQFPDGQKIKFAKLN